MPTQMILIIEIIYPLKKHSFNVPIQMGALGGNKHYLNCSVACQHHYGPSTIVRALAGDCKTLGQSLDKRWTN